MRSESAQGRISICSSAFRAVCAQKAEIRRVGLARDHAATGADSARGEQRVEARRCADIERVVAGAQTRGEASRLFRFVRAEQHARDFAAARR